MDDYLYELPIKTLPGIGHVLEEKLKKRNVLTCGQLRMIPKVSLYVHYYYYYFFIIWTVIDLTMYQTLNCKLTGFNEGLVDTLTCQ